MMMDILLGAVVATVLHVNVWAGLWAFRRLRPRPLSLNGDAIHPDILAENPHLNPYLASEDPDTGIQELLRSLQGG